MPRDLHLVVCAFDTPSKADTALEAIASWDRDAHALSLRNVAVVSRAADGRVQFHETGDSRPDVERMAGSIAGGITWLVHALGSSLGIAATELAARQGEMAAHRLLRDAGFPDVALVELGEVLGAGSSALITLVEPEKERVLVEQLEKLGGTLVNHMLPADVVAHLATQQGR